MGQFRPAISISLTMCTWIIRSKSGNYIVDAQRGMGLRNWGMTGVAVWIVAIEKLSPRYVLFNTVGTVDQLHIDFSAIRPYCNNRERPLTCRQSNDIANSRFS